MKITEVTQSSEKYLTEVTTPSGSMVYLTEDMNKIAEAHAEGQWSQSMTGDELSSLMESWVA